uniref:Uncharacterized protein n=1 Tax=Picea sitchensis TaxID=3332 RepID=B8LNH1_PICSI|nr:unknown [Picea sitchensis]
MLHSISCYKFSPPSITYSLPLPGSVHLNSVSRELKNFYPHGKLLAHCSSKKKRIGCNGLARLEPLQAASEGLPTELVEDPKFVPLNEDDPRFGPPALLLLGFKHEEVSKVQALLKEMDGEFLKVLLYTSDMVKLTLWDAMHVEQEDLKKVKVADGLPRICFLSGLSGEETMMFIDAFPEVGLESTVFAALVPNSAGKSLEELIDEIMGDHERLTGQQQSIKT